MYVKVKVADPKIQGFKLFRTTALTILEKVSSFAEECHIIPTLQNLETTAVTIDKWVN
jgi:hypothetical protein